MLPVLSYRTRGVPGHRARAIVWLAVQVAVTCTLVAIAGFLHLSDGRGRRDSAGQMFAAVCVLAYAVAYAARGVFREAGVSFGLKLIQFAAVLGCLWQTVAVYAQLNFVRDGWALAQLWPDARGAFAGLAGCVAVFAAARLRIWISARRRAAVELPPSPTP